MGDRPIRTVEDFEATMARIEEMAPGFQRAHPLRGMFNLAEGGYQFGYEVCGYGTVVGYCADHVHATRDGAEECGTRFFAGEPPRRKRPFRKRR